MSIRSLIRRTQVRQEQVLYESRQAMRSAPDRNAWEDNSFGGRILLTANPVALVADSVQVTEASQPGVPGSQRACRT